MSHEPLVIRGSAALAARPVAFGTELSPEEVLATGPWADSYHEVRASAHTAGYQDGLAAGREAGLVQGRQEAVSRTRSAVDALDEAGRRLAAVDAAGVGDVAGTVVELALELAGLILQREVDHSAEPAREALARVLPLAPERGALVVRLNPDDRRTLDDLDAIAPGREVAVVADPTLGRGDAVIDAGPSRIDGRLEQLLDQVARALRGEPRA